MKKIIISFVMALLFISPAHADINTGLLEQWEFNQGQGTAEIVEVPNFTKLQGLNQMTISMWVKLNAASGLLNQWGNGRVITAHVSTYKNVRFLLTYKTSSGTVASIDYSGARDFTFNTWQHIVMQYDGQKAYLYVNGKLNGTVVTGTGGAIATGVSDPFKIGYSNLGSLSLNGFIDDVRIYNRVLVSADIAELCALKGCPTTTTPTPSPTPTPTPNPSPSPSPTGIMIYHVSPLGNDQNPGTESQPFATIQKCADMVNPGDTCLIQAGTYARVDVRRGGVKGKPVTFKALNGVTSNGFYIRFVDYVKIEGFTFTGNVTSLGSWMLEAHGNYNDIGHNTFTGTFTKPMQGMIQLAGSYNRAHHNIIKDWIPGSVEETGIHVGGSTVGEEGSYNLVDYNTIKDTPDINVFRAFGHHQIFRRNFVSNIYDHPSVNTHTDWIQSFGNNGHQAYEMLFEENFTTGFNGQIADTGQRCGLSPTGGVILDCGPESTGASGAVSAVSGNMLTDQSKKWNDTAVFITSGNAKGKIYLIESSTTTRLVLKNSDGSPANLLSDGLVTGDEYEIRFYGQLFAPYMQVGKKNTIASVGVNTIDDPSKDFTNVRQDNHWKHVLVSFVTGQAKGKIYAISSNNDTTLTVRNIDDTPVNLNNEGVVPGDRYEIRTRQGWWTFKNNIFHNSQFPDAPFQVSGSMPYMSFINNTFVDTRIVFSGGTIYGGRALHGKVVGNIHVTKGFFYQPQGSGIYPVGDNVVKDTFYADYNLHAGAAPGYVPKDERCSEEYKLFSFCEAVWPGKHGINGKNPLFRDINDPLGPDGKPFTLDDGLKPLAPGPNAVVCAKGPNGVDIGAYSCDPNKVFSLDSIGEDPDIDCSPANILCVDDTPGATQEYSTAQACANAAKPGDTCLVNAGKYPEFVQVDYGGLAGNPVIFKANGTATIEGFRIKKPYVTVDGFDITGYAIGLSPGSITVEPGAHYCTIKNNTIRDGVQMLSSQYYFDASSRTITNQGEGSFIEAGFKPGTKFYIGSNINREIKNANELRTIKSVTDKTITVEDNETLISEGPVLALIYATRGNTYFGVAGIAFVLSSSNTATNGTIIDNTISNLAGGAMNINGYNHLIERNVIEKMNGWRIFQLAGSNNQFRYNHLRNSPRYAGFEPPLTCAPGETPGQGCAPDQSSGGHWDFVSQIWSSAGTTSLTGNDNLVEYNFIENLDNQIFDFSEKSVIAVVNGQLVYGGQETKRVTIRNNVFYGVEFHGAIHRPETIIENNTFIKSARQSPAVFAVSNGYVASKDSGSAEGSIVRKNIFVENGPTPNPGGNKGWYHFENISHFIRDYNFVAGPAAEGFPAKEGFVGKEANGINGGNPRFVNMNNPTGPDGKPFTDDDGLRPAAGSPLCLADGSYVGAYVCEGQGPNPVAGNGDVSGDGKVTMFDAALTLRYTLGASLSDAQKQKADMNADGKIDGADVVSIARKALGL